MSIANCFFVILPYQLEAIGFRKIKKYKIRVLTSKTMEKNNKVPKASNHRSYFIMKVLLFVLCVAFIVLLAVVAKCLASLKEMNSRLNAVEEDQNLKSLRSEKLDQETRRSKRSIKEAEFNKAMIKLEKLEGR